MDGRIQEGHAPSNKFKIEIIPRTGADPLPIPPLTVTEMGELGEKIILAKMPDRSKQPTGESEVDDVTMSGPLHHNGEFEGMNAWRLACKLGAPSSKQDAIVYYLGADGQPVRATHLKGVLLSEFKTSELKAADDGSMGKWTATLSIDDIDWI